jgi:hypothetical protein
MQNKQLIISAKMAVVMGVLLPLAETIRRIDQILDFREFFSWFDDYLLGAVLLWAAYCAFKKVQKAVAYLIAAWGIGTGALFLSFFGQFSYYQTASGDPGIFSTTFVAIAKGLILLYMIIGLLKAIKADTLQK